MANASMQRRRFELIASAIRDASDGGDEALNIAVTMAERLSRTNDNFDRQRFMYACGFDVSVEEGRAALDQPKMKEVVNLMSGKAISIPEDTPLCCDPSSETYWSM